MPQSYTLNPKFSYRALEARSPYFFSGMQVMTIAWGLAVVAFSSSRRVAVGGHVGMARIIWKPSSEVE